MAVYRYAREVHDDEFVARVRRHDPASLLPLVGHAASQWWENGSWLKSPYTKYTPWGLLEVARVSAAYGNRFRESATEHDLLECLSAFSALRDPELGQADSWDALAGFFLRMGTEQLTFQQPIYNELARTAALFVDSPATRPLEVLRDEWDTELFGCDLGSYVGIALLMFTAAWRNAGTFDFAWLSQDNFRPILAEVSEASIRGVLERHLITTIDKFKVANEKFSRSQDSRWRRFEYNPLVDTPILAGVTDSLLIPAPLCLVRKASPLGVYYAGVGKWGNAFARDVGYVFEQYVGRNLRLLPEAQLYPAIRYGRDNRESVDWIVVSERAVLLFEVKSVRPTEVVRMGAPAAAQDLVRMLKKAVDQLRRTEELIRTRHPAFLHIPSNRPIIGVVVTMEPFHTVNAPMTRKVLPDLPFSNLIASASELEHFVKTDSAIELLLAHLSDPAKVGWSLDTALAGHLLQRNEVLDAGWRKYPWKEAAEESEMLADG